MSSKPIPSPQLQGGAMIKLNFKHTLETMHDGSESKLCSQSEISYLVQCILEREWHYKVRWKRVTAANNLLVAMCMAGDGNVLQAIVLGQL